MKKRKLNKRERWKIHQVLWDMCQEYEITGTKNTELYDSYEKLAQKIIESHPEISIDLLQVINGDTVVTFFMGKRDKEEMNNDDLDNIFNFESVVQVLKNVLNNQKPNIIDYEKPRRSISPRKTSYFAVGHSKLNIGKNKISDEEMFRERKPYR